MIKYFPAITDRASSGLCVYVPDLPECASAGNSLQEAARSAEEGLQGRIDLMMEDGDVLPERSALDVINVEINQAVRDFLCDGCYKSLAALAL